MILTWRYIREYLMLLACVLIDRIAGLRTDEIYQHEGVNKNDPGVVMAPQIIDAGSGSIAPMISRTPSRRHGGKDIRARLHVERMRVRVPLSPHGDMAELANAA